MPAKSKKQQMAAGTALSAKRGEKKKSSLKGAPKSMEKSMTKKELEDFASTKRKNLPKKEGKVAPAFGVLPAARRSAVDAFLWEARELQGSTISDERAFPPRFAERSVYRYSPRVFAHDRLPIDASNPPEAADHPTTTNLNSARTNAGRLSQNQTRKKQ